MSQQIITRLIYGKLSMEILMAMGKLIRPIYMGHKHQLIESLNMVSKNGLMGSYLAIYLFRHFHLKRLHNSIISY